MQVNLTTNLRLEDQQVFLDLEITTNTIHFARLLWCIQPCLTPPRKDSRDPYVFSWQRFGLILKKGLSYWSWQPNQYTITISKVESCTIFATHSHWVTQLTLMHKSHLTLQHEFTITGPVQQPCIHGGTVIGQAQQPFHSWQQRIGTLHDTLHDTKKRLIY